MRMPTMAPAAVASMAVVFALFFVMQQLIAVDYEEPDDRVSVRIGDIWHEEQAIEDRFDDVKKIDEPEQPPEPIERPRMTADIDDSVDISVVAPPTASGFTTGIMDGELTSLVAISPEYPRRAAERGLSGYVVLRFTVTTEGTTDDVVVVESSNAVFNSSARRAAARLRFKPRVVDGEPQAVYNYPWRFTYTLEEEEGRR